MRNGQSHATFWASTQSSVDCSTSIFHLEESSQCKKGLIKYEYKLFKLFGVLRVEVTNNRNEQKIEAGRKARSTGMKSFGGDRRVEMGRKTAALRARQRQRQESRRWSPSGRLRTPASREIGGLPKKITIPWNDRFMFDDESDRNNTTDSKAGSPRDESCFFAERCDGKLISTVRKIDCLRVETSSVGVSPIRTANEKAAINATKKPDEIEAILDQFEALILTMEMEEALVKRELDIKKNEEGHIVNTRKISPTMSKMQDADKNACKTKEKENRSNNEEDDKSTNKEKENHIMNIYISGICEDIENIIHRTENELIKKKQN